MKPEPNGMARCNCCSKYLPIRYFAAAISLNNYKPQCNKCIYKTNIYRAACRAIREGRCSQKDIDTYHELNRFWNDNMSKGLWHTPMYDKMMKHERNGMTIVARR